MNCTAVILAAGEGTRMKSALPKVLHKAAGIPMVERVVRAAEQATGQKPILVYGSGGNLLPDYFQDRCRYALQAERKGSGHAAMMAADAIRESGCDYVVVMAGDMPLITAKSLRMLLEEAEKGEYGGVLLTGILEDPTGYGRIVRDEDGYVQKIVEQVDATKEQRAIQEVNISIYCFRADALLKSFVKLTPNNKKNEYYITDCIGIIRSMGYRFGSVALADMRECEGVNDRVQLARAARVLFDRKNESLMCAGVEIIDPATTYISEDVHIGRDSKIYPGTVIEGRVNIGERVTIYPQVRIADSEIGDGAVIEASIIEGEVIAAGAKIGPFYHSRSER